MKIFKEPNLSDDWKCPICKTAEKKEVALIPIKGTEDGNITKARQYHLECIQLIEYSRPPANMKGQVLLGMVFMDIGIADGK